MLRKRNLVSLACGFPQNNLGLEDVVPISESGLTLKSDTSDIKRASAGWHLARKIQQLRPAIEWPAWALRWAAATGCRHCRRLLPKSSGVSQQVGPDCNLADCERRSTHTHTHTHILPPFLPRCLLFLSHSSLLPLSRCLPTFLFLARPACSVSCAMSCAPLLSTAAAKKAKASVLTSGRTAGASRSCFRRTGRSETAR
jgi:hypothetical protein